MTGSCESKLTANFLNDYLQNTCILDWTFIDGKYETKKPDGFNQFIQELPLLVEEIKCKGKFVYFSLFNENGHFYIMHSLKKTGRWQKKFDDDCKCIIEIDKKDPLWFSSDDDFYIFKFTNRIDIINKHIEELGPDILNPREFTLNKMKDIIDKNKRKNITSILMCQDIISGISNYIKCESLYYSKISPFRKAYSLSENDIEKLYQGIVYVSRCSYNYGGISSKYTTDKEIDSIVGYFDDQLKIFENKKAKVSDTSDGLITYWDPKIQK